MNLPGLQGLKLTLSQRNFSVMLLGWDSKEGWTEEHEAGEALSPAWSSREAFYCRSS